MGEGDTLSIKSFSDVGLRERRLFPTPPHPALSPTFVGERGNPWPSNAIVLLQYGAGP